MFVLLTRVVVFKMMQLRQNRTIYTAEFKSKVAREAIRGDETINNIAKKYEIHPNQISVWKREVIEGANNIVDRKRGKRPASKGPDREELLKTVGQLNVENDVLKKIWPVPLSRRTC
jgi:transposase